MGFRRVWSRNLSRVASLCSKIRNSLDMVRHELRTPYLSSCKKTLCFCGVPSLGFEGKFVAIARDELCAFGSRRDVTDDFDIGKGFYTLVVSEWHGEEEFVVLTSIEGAGVNIEIELFGCDCCWVVDGETFFKDATTT